MKRKLHLSSGTLLLSAAFYVLSAITHFANAQSKVTVTIGYPDDDSYFIYGIPSTIEHAQFGGEYYLKVENTGTVNLSNWEIHTFWKALNNTWGVVQKTTIDATTGEVLLSGPTWNTDLAVGESFVLNGEWVPSFSVEDWKAFLPNEITMTANGQSVAVEYLETGVVNAQSGAYDVQIVKPITSNRKTFANQKVVAYFPLFDIDNAWCSLQRYGENIDQIRIQLYSITTQGELRAGQNLPLGLDPVAHLDYWYDIVDSVGIIDYCIAHNIEIIPVAFNYNSDLGDFDQNGVHYMLTTPSVRSQHLNDLNQVLLDHPEFAGIDIDYESLLRTDKSNYSLFMEDLSTIVHAQNKLLTTAVHTKVGPGTWYGPQAQNYERIGNAVDEMLLMTYDLHWATSPTYSNPPPTAGCQSTPDWMNDVAFFAVSEIIDPSKIQLGIPFYGYRWKENFENHTLNDPGIGLTYKEAQELIAAHNVTTIQRDPNGKDPYFTINLNGIDWVCYYQDSISLDYKLSALFENDLIDYIGGIGIWRLGQEDDQLWNALHHSLFNSPAVIQTAFDCSLTASLSEQSAGSTKIYPNPTTGELSISREKADFERALLFDNQGRYVAAFELTESLEQISIQEFAPGLYTLHFSDLHGKSRSRIIQIVKQ